MKWILSLVSISAYLFSLFTAEASEHRFHAQNLLHGFKICLIGDSGMSLPTQYLVAAALKKEKCDQIRILGDIIYPKGIKSVKSPLLYTGFIYPYGRLLKHIPFHLALGNHDHKGNADAWLDVAKKFKNVIFPSRYYSEQWGDLCVLTLDTDPILLQEDSHFIAEQEQWLVARKRQLQQSCAMSLAIGHHPYLSAGKHGDADGQMKDFLENQIIGSFDFYLAGHDHQISHEGAAQGTELLISGAAGFVYPLERDAPAGGYAGSHLGYITLTVERQPQLAIRYDLYKVALGVKRMHSGVKLSLSSSD